MSNVYEGLRILTRVDGFQGRVREDRVGLNLISLKDGRRCLFSMNMGVERAGGSFWRRNEIVLVQRPPNMFYIYMQE